MGDVPPDKWGELLKGLNLGDWRERVRRAREEYDIRRNVHELIRFYQRLGGDRPGAPTLFPYFSSVVMNF